MGIITSVLLVMVLVEYWDLPGLHLEVSAWKYNDAMFRNW